MNLLKTISAKNVLKIVSRALKEISVINVRRLMNSLKVFVNALKDHFL